jgi:peroxiredoxin
MMVPSLEALYSRYQTQGMEIIGISSEPLATLTAYQKSHPHSYPLFHDARQATTALYHAYAYPTLVFIDKKGIIRAIESGAQPMAAMEASIQSLLNE